MADLNLELREFTIDRSKWRSGGEGIYKHGEGLTALRNTMGQMCCLGQIATQIGLPIKNEGEPMQIAELHKLVGRNDCLLTTVTQAAPFEDGAEDYDEDDYYNSKFSNELMDINDNEDMDIIEREEQIIAAAAKHHVTIKFEKYGK